MKQCMIVVGLAVGIAGCTTNSPTGADRTALTGIASCRASARGGCPELSGRTFYNREAGEVRYFAPDGAFYSLRGTQVRRVSWAVSADGRRLRFPGDVFGSGSVGIPIRALVAIGQSIPGDPVGLASRNTVAVPLRAYDTRPFSTIAAELRG